MLNLMDRRQFACVATGVAATTTLAAPNNDRLRVAVIGHTGRGDYGHGLDTVWLRLDDTEVVAVADPVHGGVSRAGTGRRERTGRPAARACRSPGDRAALHPSVLPATPGLNPVAEIRRLDSGHHEYTQRRTDPRCPGKGR